MDSKSIIQKLGGNAEVARLCGITEQAVSQWRKAGIPRARLMYLRVIRPDVFDDDDDENIEKAVA